MNDESPEVLRLPLWRECLKKMRAEGLEHGRVYPVKFFTDELRCQPDAMQFSLGIAEIRRELEEDGCYLSGRGQRGEQFIILPARYNADVMLSYGRKAADALRRGVILGTNTPMHLLGAEDRRRHESILEKMAIKSCLMLRAATIAKALPDSAKKLLVA